MNDSLLDLTKNIHSLPQPDTSSVKCIANATVSAVGTGVFYG